MATNNIVRNIIIQGTPFPSKANSIEFDPKAVIMSKQSTVVQSGRPRTLNSPDIESAGQRMIKFEMPEIWLGTNWVDALNGIKESYPNGMTVTAVNGRGDRTSIIDAGVTEMSSITDNGEPFTTVTFMGSLE